MSNAPTRTNQISSPSPGGAKRKPVRKGWRRFFSMKRILLALLGLFLVGVATFGVAYAVIDIPDPNAMAKAQASIVYYADGETEMARINEVDGNRESVPLSKIPVHVQHALLAAEDRTFYENNGVSPSGIGRSVLVALRGGRAQGGSTITQQYVKNYFLTQDRTITRKAREFIISIKIDQQESKEKILENYLNTIYYGRGASGIQTASRAYFGHDVSKLTVAEGALLASVIRGPEFYDPAKGAEPTANAVSRLGYVLDGMVSQGWLSAQERAKTTFPKTIQPRMAKPGPIGYITAEIRKELKAKLGLSETDIGQGGLRIVSTIDKLAQASAVKAVADNMPSEKDVKDLRVGLTAIRPGDGAVVAMYGGKDIGKTQNSSTGAIMQAGSTFKVFGLLAALQRDISTKTVFDGNSPQSLPGFNEPVENFGPGTGKDYGRVDLRTATAKSVNTVFAQLNVKLADGANQATGVRDAAVLAGVPSNTLGLGTNMGNILGTASPHVIDMANAYATIAAQGQRATTYLITKVTSADKGIDYQVDKDLTRAFDEKVTADTTDAMSRVVTEGTATGARRLGRPAAGKTGTTDDNKSAWFVGFTPQLSAAVGMYQGDDNETITVRGFGEFTGGGVPVDIWTAFMKGALEGEKVLDLPERVGVGDEVAPPPATAPPRAVPPTTTAPPMTTAPPTTAPPTVVPTEAPQPTAPPTTFQPPTTTQAPRSGPQRTQPVPVGAGQGSPSLRRSPP